MNSSARSHGTSPNRQLTYGCLGILIVGASVWYCLGFISLLARPLLFERAAPTASNELDLPATPTTRPLPTFIQLPTGALVATPTQAPIPTREPSTLTPTLDPFATLSSTAIVTPRASASPSLRANASATATRRVTPTATPR